MTLTDALAAAYHKYLADAPCFHATHTYPPDCEAFAAAAAADLAFRAALTAALTAAMERTPQTDYDPCANDPAESAAAIVAHLLPVEEVGG